ncbi:1761_t:CDS:2, partial [Acaulospora colombiana]
MAQRAGGLYGGIRFSTASALPQDNIQPSSSSIIPKPIAEKAPAKEPLPVAVEVSQEKQENVETAAPEASTKSSAGWSAALAFAPVRRSTKPKPSTSRLPPGAAFVASLAAAATTAAPQLAPVTAPVDQEPNEPEVSGWGKKIKAPSMVLDEDVNGFRRIQPGEGKRKKKKNINVNQLTWDPFEQYDPFHPNDYHEYKNWKKKEREERRMQERRRVEELKRRREGDWSEDSSENDSEDARYHSPERDEERPMGLGMAKVSSNMETDDHQDIYRPPTPPSQFAAAQVSTGEEAYLRRLQMSRGFVKQSSPPEAPPSFIDSSHSTPEQLQAPPPISPLPQPTFVPSSQPGRDGHPIPQPEETYSSPLAPSAAPPAASSAPLTQDVIDERRKTAAAIAARLSALSKIQLPPVVPVS